MITNKRIFITGGAGYLGSNIINRYYGKNEITVYSRDEAKHYYLKKRFPGVNCIIGDIRNLSLLRDASENHDIGIFAASLKQIEAVDQNVQEALKIIIDGAINSRIAAEKNNFEAACFISTDKSRAATTLYGSMKFVAGESFIVNAGKNDSLNLSCAVYGNVANSTGSVIPFIWDAIDKNHELELYSKEMTRFIIMVDEAIDLIEEGLRVSGFNIIPKIPSIAIKDLFEIYRKKFGLKFIETSPRISEKIHEIMISSEEIPRVIEKENYFLMHYKDIYNSVVFKDNEYSSRNCLLSKNKLNSVLMMYNYFDPR